MANQTVDESASILHAYDWSAGDVSFRSASADT